MTLAMPDSITVASLPPGYDAYLGYADGQWPTEAALKAAFPGKPRIILTVTGTTLTADGIDVEPGNVNAADARVWVQRKLAAAPASRPVIYAAVVGQPNFGMGNILDVLARNSIPRTSVRLLSAHYGWAGPGGTSAHICGPATCRLIGTPMDGTQWTDRFPGQGGQFIDMSMLEDSFLGPVPTWTEKLMQQLPTVGVGERGEQVRSAQALCVARGQAIAIDGSYGAQTFTAVQRIQRAAGIAADGIVGPQTWPVLLGIAKP